MKRIVVMSLVLMFLFHSPIFAFSIGVSENERHGGINWSLEVYYTEDSATPTTGDTPAYFLKSNQFEPSLANHIPGFSGKFWLLVKPHIINTGKIKQIESKASGQKLDYNSGLGGFLIDLSQLQAGKYFVSLSVDHLGGQTTYNIIATLWRSVHEISDQNGFFLGIYNPERIYHPAEILASRYMNGFEPSNGAATFKQTTGQDLPVAVKNIANAALGKVQIYLFDELAPISPSKHVHLRLTSIDGSINQTTIVTNGVATFDLPEGVYTIEAQASDADGENQWQILNQATNCFGVKANSVTRIMMLKG